MSEGLYATVKKKRLKKTLDKTTKTPENRPGENIEQDPPPAKCDAQDPPPAKCDEQKPRTPPVEQEVPLEDLLDVKEEIKSVIERTDLTKAEKAHRISRITSRRATAERTLGYKQRLRNFNARLTTMGERQV